MSAALEPAWVLSQRPYGNGGKLLELFAVQQGRLGAVARGIHRKAHGGQPAHLLQPFQPLLIVARGRGELKTLTHIEPAGLAYRLEGNRSLCGFYLNELLLRMLARFDPHPELFAHYGEALEALTVGDVAPPLRRFEVQLLQELGYRMSWDSDADGNPLVAAQHYQFYPESGFQAVAGELTSGTLLGSELLEIGAWLAGTKPVPGDNAMKHLKQITRLALSPLLGDRPLQTRLMANSLNWAGER
ncbi:MAG: DNA repair protein RecO [Halieaceae bacterium]|jgi:DNA repair protein RecO (recombination protein O)|nr:DNA repair protein RecO [Halieaceae bacterium]